MLTLLDEQKARQFREDELRQEGRAEGRSVGENLMALLITRLNVPGRMENRFVPQQTRITAKELYHEFKQA